MRKRKQKSLATMVKGITVALVISTLGAAGGLTAAASAATAGKTAGAVTAKKHAKKKHAKKKTHKPKTHKPKPKPKPTTAAPQALGEGAAEKGATKAVENATEIPLAPEWTEQQLNVQPSGNWISPEGGTTGDHYSQLSELTTSNVASLKVAWMTQLDGSAEATKYSGEAPPVEYDGVLYYVTGADDVFALSVASGKILWTKAGELPETVNDVCCGWDNRGLALGDGMVYTALLTGSVEALNQKTGAVVWKSELGQPSEGLTVTSAPLYYNGMIFIGPVGSEYGVRGYIAAFNAKTGAMIWKHYNIPAPGEYGHTTWPTGTTCNQCNGEWTHGGATTWDAPTVDDKTGDIYYSTANAAPDYQGVTRGGENLWATSILALNYKTGELAWGYQAVHHDIWDYDMSSQPLMINVEVGGKKVEGIDQNDKDGFSYFVNAQTGSPVFPIEEKPVPQDVPGEATFPTQPIPTMPPFDPEKPTAEMFKQIQEAVNVSAASHHLPAPTIVENGGYNGEDVFSPIGIIGESTIQVSSGGGSGDREAPPAFDPATGDMFVCTTFASEGAKNVSAEIQHPEEGKGYDGIGGISGSATTKPGYLVGYNMHTGEKLWSDEFKNQCYSGVLATKSGVIFVPDWEGEMVAYEGSTGKKLWSFELGAGGGPPSAFEFDGHEYVAVYAGGNDDGNTQHGDNLWLFSLNGTSSQGPIALGKTPPPSETIKE